MKSAVRDDNPVIYLEHKWIYRRIKAQPRVNPTLIFLEASHSTLVRRFSETRRPHPLHRRWLRHPHPRPPPG